MFVLFLFYLFLEFLSVTSSFYLVVLRIHIHEGISCVELNNDTPTSSRVFLTWLDVAKGLLFITKQFLPLFSSVVSHVTAENIIGHLNSEKLGRSMLVC